MYALFMTRRAASVAVIESAATYRRGLEAALAAADFRLEMPSQPVAWAAEASDRVVIVTIRDQSSCDLIEAVAGSGGKCVALLPEANLEMYSHALRHGAVAAADWNDEPEAIVEVVNAAVRGRALIPIDVVHSMAKRTMSIHAPLIEAEEVGWLKALAGGASVVDLADEVGYSERSMFRRLHDLYGRLGVQTRTAALIEAERLGLLELDPQ